MLDGVCDFVRRVVVLGSTGSIGRQTLELLRDRERFQVVGLAAGNNRELLARQIDEFHPRMVFCAGGELPGLPSSTDMCTLEEMAASPDADLIVVGTVGKAGLLPALAALKAGKMVALANKEVFVMAGALVRATADTYGGTLLPVDSEHSALWQCLVGESGYPRPEIRRLVLTASGGALRDLPIKELASVTPEQALRHPTWQMGQKITVDSATLMNKGFEVMEARWLFECDWDRIQVLQHRESIVHSFVEYPDGTIKAQLGTPDMKVPLQYALSYPERWPSEASSVDFLSLGALTFGEVDYQRYPCLALAMEVARTGGTAPAALSGADEAAVGHFLAGHIGFSDIYATVADAVERHQTVAEPGLEDLLEADRQARSFVDQRAAALAH